MQTTTLNPTSSTKVKRDFLTDATRPRRYKDGARARWYAQHRSARWKARYFG